MVMDYTEIKHGGFSIYEVPKFLDNKESIYQGIEDLVRNFRPGMTDKADLIKALNAKALADGARNTIKPGPGIQIVLSHSDNPHVKTVQGTFNRAVLDFHNTKFGKKGVNTFGHSWVFISNPSNKDTNYHNHILMSPHEPLMTNTWTWVYYLELPDNCIGDEGKILFSLNGEDSNALKIFPKKDTLYIFPGYLQHRPEIAPNSTTPRITLAGNVFIEFKDKVLI